MHFVQNISAVLLVLTDLIRNQNNQKTRKLSDQRAYHCSVCNLRNNKLSEWNLHVLRRTASLRRLIFKH